MIVVYDFDKTLTYKDTLLGFFLSFSKNPIKLVSYFFAMVLTKFKVISNDTLKEIGIKLFLKGKTKDEVEKKAKEYANRIKTNKVFKEIDFSDKVYIVSASFEEYLLPLFPKATVVASKIRYKNDKASSLLFNCYSKAKIKAIKDKKVLKIDTFFTDSYSDKPLAEISKKIVIVDGDKTTTCKNIDEFKRYFKGEYINF